MENFGYALAEIEVLKTPDKHVIHAPGDQVTYRIDVQNTGPVDVTLNQLADDRFGDLDGEGSCSLPQPLVPGAIYSCNFTRQINGIPLDLHHNTVTAAASDADGNSVFSADSALVTIIDGSTGSIGHLVWFDENMDGIRNEGEPGLDNVTLDLMKDTTDDGNYDVLVGSTATLSSGEYSFSSLSAGSYQVVVTDVHAVLDGLILTGGTEPHQVNLTSAEIYDLANFGYAKPPLPLVSVVKRAAVSSIHAPGADVSYGVAVKNVGETNLTLSSLLDSKFGNLNGKGSCAVPQAIAMGDLYFCAFSAFVAGDPGDVHTNVVFAVANDNSGNVVHDHDDASVDIVDSNTGAIGYLVWNDENADGIVDPGEAGLANVTLNLLQDTDKDGSFETTVGTLTTTAGGTYAFTGLATGSYWVHVTDGNNVLDGMVLTGGVDPHDISLGVGQVYASANFGYSRGSIDVIKLGDKSAIHAPGENVTYTITVENTSYLELTLTSLVDDKFGDLTLRGCQLPQTLLAQSFYSCSFSAALTGNVGDQHTNTVTATAEDVVGNQVADSDNFTVTFIDSFTGAIGDKVWLDSNRDGIQDPLEAGLAFVTLELWQDVDANGSYETPLGERVTNADGGYAFISLAQGKYRVSVTDRFGIVTGMNLTGGTNPHDIDLAVGQLYPDADFGYSYPPVPGILVLKNADVSSIHAPGGSVTYTVDVHNTGETVLSLTTLTDSKFGDLDTQGSCSLPQVIPLGGLYSCSFSGIVTGNVGDTHTNEVLGTANDGQGNVVNDIDTAQVTIIDSNAAAIGYRVWLDTNADGIMDPGEAGLDNVTLTLLEDTDGDGNYETTAGTTATTGGGNYAFTQLSMGNYSVVVTDTNNLLDGMILTGGTEPHQVNLGSGSIYNLANFGYAEQPLPLISVVKRAMVSSIHAPGADVNYEVAVKNIGGTNLTLSSLVDSKFADLNGRGSCSVPQTIAMGDLYFCAFSAFVAGDPGDVHTNVVFAIARDSLGNLVQDHDDASVDIIDSNTGAIGYLVWNDENADGIADPGEAGLANVTLSLLQDADNDGSFEATIGSLTTTAGGTYAFTGLAAGSYRVDVTDDNNILNGMMLTHGADPHDIFLGVGQVYASANFGYSRGAINVIKQGDRSAIHAPGETVAYTVTVENTSYLELTLTSLIDDKFGDLTLQGCQLPQTLPALSSYSCSFSESLSGNVGDQHTNTVTAVAEDVVGNQVADSDNFTVTFIDSFAGAIGDRVWLDRNRDGMQDPLEAGLAFVTLGLWQDADTNGSYETPLGERVTNADGEYAFIGLAQGKYRVSVTDRLGILVGMNLTGGTQPHDIDLAAGQIYPDADFGYSYPPVPGIQVIKNANVSSIHAPGGSVTYTVGVQNTGETILTLTSLIDSKFSDLNSQGSCSLPQVIPLGGLYSCFFTGNVTGNVGDIHTNEVLGTATDDLGNVVHDIDTAQVNIIDSRDAAIGYRIWLDTNADGIMNPGEPGLDNVTLTLLRVTNIDGNSEPTRGTTTVVATTATTGGGIYAFTRLAAGNYSVLVSDTNNLLNGMVLSGGTEPHDLVLAQSQIYSGANFGYTRASMDVVKSGDRPSVEAPGGPVTYTVTTMNSGPIDITLDSLTDDKFGNLDNQGDCQLPRAIAAGSSYTCSFSAMVTGNAGEIHTNVVTARAHDNEGNQLSGTDYWVVSLDSEPPLPPSIPPKPVPTLSELGVILLYLLLLVAGLAEYRKRST